MPTVAAHRSGLAAGAGRRLPALRLAAGASEGLAGWVRNLSGQVEVLAQGGEAALSRFKAALVDEAPALARPVLLSVTREAAAAEVRGFRSGKRASSAAGCHCRRTVSPATTACANWAIRRPTLPLPLHQLHAMRPALQR